MSEKAAIAAHFSIWDYLVFSAVLVISAAIGFYHAFAGGGQKTTTDFLMGGRQMGTFPIALSLMASFMSAVSILGYSAEIYIHGTQFFLIPIAFCIAMPICAYIYLPVFYQLEITSANEYFEKRFSSFIRKLASAIYVFQMVIYLSIVMYGPALALNQVTGLHVWGSIGITALVCIFYTTVGGMKAVMWTDAFQVAVMFGSVLAVSVQGCIDIGGLTQVWEANVEGNRVELPNFDPNPFLRHTVWTISIGGAHTWLAIYGANQAQIQRYLTSPSLRVAQRALLWNIIGLTVVIGSCCFAGFVMFSKYATCDPIKSGRVSAMDQMLPLFVMETLGKHDGFPGFFVAGVFSGSLSTLSSGLNSLAAVTLEDFIKPLAKLSEQKATIISKLLALLFGMLVVAMVAVAEQVGNILQAVMNIFSMIGGPTLGMFSLGMLFPWANTWGAGIGFLSGLALVFWIGIGAQIKRLHISKLPVSVAGCNVTLGSIQWYQEQNVTLYTALPDYSTPSNIVNFTTVEEQEEILPIYYLSYLYYGPVAVWTVIIVGLTVSYITGCSNAKDLDPRVITPVVHRVYGWFTTVFSKNLPALKINNTGQNENTTD